MTAHVHDPAAHPVDEVDDAPPGDASARGTSPRPRWLMPAIAAGVVVAGLVVAGVLSLSTALYAAMFGGMLLMHLGGHGMHGMPGGYGADGHAGRAGGGSSDGPAPSAPQRMVKTIDPGSAAEAGTGVPGEGRGDGAQQRGLLDSHGCH